MPVFVSHLIPLSLCVRACVRGCVRVCVCVKEDLPEDSSHAPLISTATCWLLTGSVKINPASLKDPRKRSDIFALINTLIIERLYIYTWYGMCDNVCVCLCRLGHLCVCVCVCLLCHQIPSAGDPLLSARNIWLKTPTGFPFVKNPIRLQNAIITKWQLSCIFFFFPLERRGGGCDWVRSGYEMNRLVVRAGTGDC